MERLNGIPTVQQMQKDKQILRNRERYSHTDPTTRPRRPVRPIRSKCITSIPRQSPMLTNSNETLKYPTGETISPLKNDMSSQTTLPGPSRSISNNRLKDQFSRLQYSRSSYTSPPTHAITRLAIPLKNGARNPYYTDIIGNVSTSRFRPARGSTDSHLEIQPRFPIYGGWNYTFRLGWNVDLDRVQRKTNSERILKLPFLEGPENVQYGKMALNIILPEGARYPPPTI
jgi:hypothetical protein